MYDHTMQVYAELLLESNFLLKTKDIVNSSSSYLQQQ